LLDPASLIRGLAEALPPNVTLYEKTPLLSLQRKGQWYLETPAAQITAPTVIMATNAAIRHFGYLRDRLVTIYTYAALTDPLGLADAAQLGSMPVWGLLPSHRLGTTVRRFGRCESDFAFLLSSALPGAAAYWLGTCLGRHHGADLEWRPLVGAGC
jgi:glycine/D-amino acid oxidase-like deaminating enzyme